MVSISHEKIADRSVFAGFHPAKDTDRPRQDLPDKFTDGLWVITLRCVDGCPCRRFFQGARSTYNLTCFMGCERCMPCSPGMPYDARKVIKNAASARSLGEPASRRNRDVGRTQNRKTPGLVMKSHGELLRPPSHPLGPLL
jgi:hypothetical protein